MREPLNSLILEQESIHKDHIHRWLNSYLTNNCDDVKDNYLHDSELGLFSQKRKKLDGRPNEKLIARLAAREDRLKCAELHL